MNLAVNYSPAAARLLAQGRLGVDYLKCPAWPELIATARALHPSYVHFPLNVGLGSGDAINSETGRPPDWTTIEALLAQTGTPLVNVHLSPRALDYPDIPSDSAAPAHVEPVQASLLRDLLSVVRRFGPDRVMAESVYGARYMRAATMPGVIHRVVEEAGCGFLLDLSHARLAARALGMDERAYVEALPLTRIREIHLTGIQTFDERWVGVLRGAGIGDDVVQRFVGRTMDHLPLVEADWEITAWALERVRRGAWGQPWVVAFEYGGVGSPWEAMTDEQTLQEQVSRLRSLLL